jgi:hypothetical protein
VPFRLAGVADPVQIRWGFGDEATSKALEVAQMYASAGLYTVRADVVCSDGATAFAQIEITIEALYGNLQPVAPPVCAGDESGVVNLTVSVEPTAGEMAQFMLVGPPSISAPGTLTRFVDEQTVVVPVDGFGATRDIPFDEAGRFAIPWIADIGPSTFSGVFTLDVGGVPIDFGDPTAQTGLRPGVPSSVCTTNFIFHYKWYRFFVGSAAHCVDDLDINDVCSAKPTGRIGSRESLAAYNANLRTAM